MTTTDDGASADAVTAAAHARALAHPARHRLLLELDDTGATVSQLSHRLRTNKGNVAHHLGVLAAAGLVRKDRTRTVRGGTEQYFVRTAGPIRFEDAPDGHGTVAMMSNLADELVADPQALINHRVLRLTAGQASSLAEHLDRTVHTLVPAAEGELVHGVVVGVYRRRPPRTSTYTDRPDPPSGHTIGR